MSLLIHNAILKLLLCHYKDPQKPGFKLEIKSRCRSNGFLKTIKRMNLSACRRRVKCSWGPGGAAALGLMEVRGQSFGKILIF